MTDLILPGDIPGLLRRGSPVLVDTPLRVNGGGAPALVLTPGRRIACIQSASATLDVDVLGGVFPEHIHLDLTDPTGRCHAAWWLMRYKRPAMVETHASWGPYSQGLDWGHSALLPALHTGSGQSYYYSEVNDLCPDLNWHDRRVLSDGSKWVYAEALRRMVLHVAVSKVDYRMCKKEK